MDPQQVSVVTHPVEDECSFCPPAGQPEWFNRPIAQGGDFAFAIPSLGSFRPGYLLAMPTEHTTAICRIAQQNKAGFAEFVSDLIARLSHMYRTPVTIFEHGACLSPVRARSACVSHAHLHIIPGYYDLMSTATGDVSKYGSLQEFMDEERDDPYLMLQDPGGPVVSFTDRPMPQFFRRVIACRLAIGERWDYALFPFFDNLLRTYLDFGIESERVPGDL